MANGNGAVVSAPRLPYIPELQERFGIDKASWRALIDAIYPLATSVDSVVLALSYCRARKLDPFKRAVHIVPVWSKGAGRMIDTVWPGIGELRTTAFRTGLYAGRDETVFGDDCTHDLGGVAMTYPEWCRVTVYRMIGDQRVAFAGPKVYWIEAYASAKRDSIAPNDMWKRRPRGQLEKCSEAAALRAAFPEELGNDYAAEEMAGQVIDTDGNVERGSHEPRPTRADFRDDPKITDIDPAHAVETAPADEPFVVVTIDGEEIQFGDAQASASALRRILHEAAQQRGNAGIEGAWESNSALLDALKGRGFDALADDLVAYQAELLSGASAAAEESDKPPRSTLWADADYAVPPPKNQRTGRSDWRALATSLIHLASEAETHAELAKLKGDNQNGIDGMKISMPDAHAEVQQAFVARQSELA